MKKNTLLVALSLFISLFLVTPVFAAPTVIMDGKQLSFDVPPAIEDGRTLVPLRAIFEAMGATVTWDQDTQTATAVKDTTTVMMQIGSIFPTINGQVSQLGVPAKIVDGRTLAPLRFIGEAFGGSVGWDGATQTITISTGAVSIPAPVVSNSPAPAPAPASDSEPSTVPVLVTTPVQTVTDSPYIGNSGTKKFHYATCSSAEKITSANRVEFTSKETAINQGYEACKRCNP